MDHPCYKCGHSVEDGKAFCSQCGAAQIRVAVPEAPVEPVRADHGALPVQDHEPGLVLPVIAASSLAAGWSRDIKACSIAAAIGVLLTFLGLNPFVAALGAGTLAVALSRRAGAVIRPAAGARLGAISGLLFFGMSMVFETLAAALLHKGAEIRSEMMDKMKQAADRYPGPQVQPFLDFVKSPGGFALMMVASLIFGLLAFIALGGLGGAIGAALLGRRERP